MNHNITALCQQHQPLVKPNISSSSPVNPCSGTCTCNTRTINDIVPPTNMPHQQLGVSGTPPSSFANPPCGIVDSSPTQTITGRLTPKRHKSVGGFGMPETTAANQPSRNYASPTETLTGDGEKSTCKEMTNRDWAGLATEPLLCILERLPIKDYVRFGSVCVSWYQTVASKLVSPAPHLPWLIVPPRGHSTTRLISNPFTDKVDFHLQEPNHLNPLCITTAGYIMYRDNHTSELVVKNPLTGSCLPFPSVTTLPPEVRNIFISSAAALLSGSTITAVAIAYTCGHGLEAAAFARLGDSKWTFFGDSVSVTSLIFHKGLLYVLTTVGSILTWDPRVHPAPPLTLSTHNLTAKYSVEDLSHYSLVESLTGGDLLQVVDNGTAWHGQATDYKVFKLDPAGTSGPKWCMVTSLCGEDALMLSERGAVCISARDFPELRQNCIYSTTLYNGPVCARALNVFNLGEATTLYNEPVCACALKVFSLEKRTALYNEPVCARALREGRVCNYHRGFRDWFIPSLD